MDIATLLGAEAPTLLDHQATAFPKDWLTLPGPEFLQDIFTMSDRSPTVLRNLGTLYATDVWENRLPVDPARGPGHRALRRGEFRAQSGVLRSARLVRSGNRGGLQRHRDDVRRSGMVAGATCTAFPSSSSSITTTCLRYPNSYDQQDVRVGPARPRTSVRWASARRSTSVPKVRFARSKR